jgi:hypothetical protein
MNTEMATMLEDFAENEIGTKGKLKYHHSAYYQGYVRRGHVSIATYNGKFGIGITKKYNDGTSCRYSRVEYHVIANNN